MLGFAGVLPSMLTSSLTCRWRSSSGVRKWGARDISNMADTSGCVRQDLSSAFLRCRLSLGGRCTLQPPGGGHLAVPTGGRESKASGSSRRSSSPWSGRWPPSHPLGNRRTPGSDCSPCLNTGVTPACNRPKALHKPGHCRLCSRLQQALALLLCPDALFSRREAGAASWL